MARKTRPAKFVVNVTHRDKQMKGTRYSMGLHTEENKFKVIFRGEEGFYTNRTNPYARLYLDEGKWITMTAPNGRGSIRYRDFDNQDEAMIYLRDWWNKRFRVSV